MKQRPLTIQTGKSEQEPKPGFWDGALGFPQAALVTATAIAIGVFFHWRIGNRLPSSPGFLLGGGTLFLVVLVFASLRWKDTRVMEWLTGVPLAITSVVGVMLTAGIGAVIPASTLQAKFGIANIYTSWPFIMAMLVMMVNLIGVTARRLFPLTYKNFCFSLNHLGLCVTLLGGVLSAAGLERGSLDLMLGQTKSVAATPTGQALHLPFSITLKKFHLEEFPPTLAVATLNPHSADGSADIDPGEQFIAPKMRERIGDYTVTVQSFLPRAARVEGVWKKVEFPAAAPAAQIAVTDRKGQTVGEGWVSSGSMYSEGEIVQVAENAAVFMPQPKPREFRSTVSIERNGKQETREILVNKPILVDGYKLYQVSYNAEMGAASDYSGIEVVRDRGLPVVYAGMFLLLGGAAMMLWNGVGVSKGEQK